MWLTDVRDVSIRRLPVVVAAWVWSMAAGAAALWYWQLPQSAHGLAEVAVVPMTPQALSGSDHGAVARALGHVGQATAAADEERRFQLQGVIAAPAGQGSALLAVDGQPARAFVQGQAVVEGWRLQFVGLQGVRLSAGQEGTVLELFLPGVDSRSSRE